MESNGSGGESWDGVLKLPIVLSWRRGLPYSGRSASSAELDLTEFLPEFFLGEREGWRRVSGSSAPAPSGTGACAAGAALIVLAALGGKEVEFAFHGLDIDPERVGGKEVVLAVVDTVDILPVIAFKGLEGSLALLGATVRCLPPTMITGQRKFPVAVEACGSIQLVDREPGVACDEVVRSGDRPPRPRTSRPAGASRSGRQNR